MKAEIKQKWTKALRSGEYTQTRLQLRANDDTEHHSYCCLGVLLDIYDSNNWRDDHYAYTEIGCRQESYEMESVPRVIREELEIPDDKHEALIRLNDDKGYNFNQIADWIETNL